MSVRASRVWLSYRKAQQNRYILINQLKQSLNQHCLQAKHPLWCCSSFFRLEGSMPGMRQRQALRSHMQTPPLDSYLRVWGESLQKSFSLSLRPKILWRWTGVTSFRTKSQSEVCLEFVSGVQNIKFAPFSHWHFHFLRVYLAHIHTFISQQSGRRQDVLNSESLQMHFKILFTHKPRRV